LLLSCPLSAHIVFSCALLAPHTLVCLSLCNISYTALTTAPCFRVFSFPTCFLFQPDCGLLLHSHSLYPALLSVAQQHHSLTTRSTVATHFHFHSPFSWPASVSAYLLPTTAAKLPVSACPPTAQLLCRCLPLNDHSVRPDVTGTLPRTARRTSFASQESLPWSSILHTPLPCP
jgi:hypothetical protein